MQDFQSVPVLVEVRFEYIADFKINCSLPIFALSARSLILCSNVSPEKTDYGCQITCALPAVVCSSDSEGAVTFFCCLVFDPLCRAKRQRKKRFKRRGIGD